jgi:hypothetical protein
VISNDEELRVMLARIDRFQQQVARLRQVETNPTNYKLSAEGYLSEIDRMNLEVRDYFSLLPSEVAPDDALPVSTHSTDFSLT